jgi:methenyltetrahydromethanopterin cyclohydrolase
MLFSPAEIVLSNLKTGRSFAFGRVRADVLYQSFFG